MYDVSLLILVPACSTQSSQQPHLLAQSRVISSSFRFWHLWVLLFARYLTFFFFFFKLWTISNMWKWKKYDELPCPPTHAPFSTIINSKPSCFHGHALRPPSRHVLLWVWTLLVLPWGEEFESMSRSSIFSLHIARGCVYAKHSNYFDSILKRIKVHLTLGKTMTEMINLLSLYSLVLQIHDQYFFQTLRCSRNVTILFDFVALLMMVF